MSTNTITPLARPINGVAYWAPVKYLPSSPIVCGSQYGVRVDVPNDSSWAYGRVFTTEALAQAYLDTLPTNYTSGRPTGYVLDRIVMLGESYSYWEHAPEEEFDAHLGHEGHWSTFGTYWCDTCNSPYCELI